MSANVNQWRSERAEKNVTSSSTTTNTPTRLREVKMASTQTKEVTKEKKSDVDVFALLDDGCFAERKVQTRRRQLLLKRRIR